ncbi:unnamed protein product [Periconia digitata]|uniref:Uncharacterized protein n=1 Tax=Periconia digitata TaxID=1303443 RepID=A0A9W4UHT7_9PLEO|nr:unnamed protein product [Periconia digitata]
MMGTVVVVTAMINRCQYFQVHVQAAMSHGVCWSPLQSPLSYMTSKAIKDFYIAHHPAFKATMYISPCSRLSRTFLYKVKPVQITRPPARLASNPANQISETRSLTSNRQGAQSLSPFV